MKFEDVEKKLNYIVPERKVLLPLQNNVLQCFCGLEDSRPKGFDRLILPYPNRLFHYKTG